jgi:hypothetical protein
MPAPNARAAAAAEKVAEKKVQEEALANRVTVAEPAPAGASAPIGQRLLAGYRIVRTFSDVSVRPHQIRRKGELVTEKREVERLARLGAQLEAVEKGEEAVSSQPSAVSRAES